MRTASGSELNRRAPTGLPEINATADISPSSSSTSLFPSLPSSPSTHLNHNFNSSSSSQHSLISEPVDVVQVATANKPAPTTGHMRGRIRWTQDMNEFIWRTYLIITKLETKIRGYLGPLYTQFTLKFPQIPVSKQRIGDQRRAIVRNHLLTHLTLKQIKDEVARTLSNEDHTNINSTQSPRTTNTATQQSTSSRMRWTDDINEAIVREYFRITNLETNKTAYRPTLHAAIIELFPQISHVSEQRIADQRRVIFNNNLVTNERIDQIREEVRLRFNLIVAENTIPVIDSANTADITTAIHEQTTNNMYTESENIDHKITETFQQTYNTFKNSNPIERPYIPKQKTSKFFSYIITYLNTKVIPSFDNQDNDFIKTQTIIYCAAYTAALCNGSKIKIRGEVSDHSNNINKDNRPNWQRRLDKRIANLRKEVGRMTQHIQGNQSIGLKTHIEKIKQKYKTHSNYEEPNNTDSQFLDTLKQKLNSLSSRRRRYLNCTERKQQNAEFINNERRFYRKLTSNTTNLQNNSITLHNLPSKEQLHEFWSDVWSKPTPHNENASWIESEKQKTNTIPAMEFECVPLEVFSNVVKTTHNWKTPGSDHIHNFYYKKFTSIHSTLHNHINHFIKYPHTAPNFITQGITYMIPKDINSTNPAKYRPITCLQTIYKIITSCISQIIHKHLSDNNILAEEQKGCRKYSQGCKEQITIDTVAMKYTTSVRKDMCTMYIDYQKAFDSVPHSWLVYILRHYKIHPVLIEFLEIIMQQWTTKLKIGKSIETCLIPIKRGIFQGDALSPLWFCLALNPLSNLLNDSASGLTIETELAKIKITHLLYMDDIKLYSNNVTSLHNLADITQTFSSDIGMTLGIDKCKTFTYRKGKFIENNPYTLVSGHTIESLDHNNMYKYLGFQQCHQINQKQTKLELIKKYKHRLNIVMKSQLTSCNLIKAINTFAIPILTYSFGIIKWSKTDLKRMQQIVNTTLSKHRKHHPRSCSQRLTLPREDGGRGIIDIENLHNKQISTLRTFFFKKAQQCPLHETIVNIDKKYTPLNLENKGTQANENILSNTDKITAWQHKSLHGRHLSDLRQPHVDMKASNAWLQRGDLFPETEGFMVAIQDQIIDTKNYQKFIIRRSNIQDLCRRCHSSSETIQHITGACRSLAQTDYKHRHDQVAAIVHQYLAYQNKLVTEKFPYYKYKPQAVLENSDFKLYWDRTIITDKTIYNNRPDITLLDKNNKTVYLIDIAICNTHNLVATHTEKIAKYTDLSIEIKTQWQIRHIRTVPIVVSSTGVIPKSLHSSLNTLNINSSTYMLLQKAVILNTCRLTRKFLNCEDT